MNIPGDRPEAAGQDQVGGGLPEAAVRAGGGAAQGPRGAHPQGEGGEVQHVPGEPLGALRAGQGLMDQVGAPDHCNGNDDDRRLER